MSRRKEIIKVEGRNEVENRKTKKKLNETKN